MTIRLRPMTIDDYDAVIALWKATEGVGLAESDERGPLAAYLARNPGLSTVAVDDNPSVDNIGTVDIGAAATRHSRPADEQIVGAMLSGHNGRRGEFVHLAVAPSHRGRGIGRRIVERCLQGLAEQGVARCNLYVYNENESGQAFWRRFGFAAREDVVFMQGRT